MIDPLEMCSNEEPCSTIQGVKPTNPSSYFLKRLADMGIKIKPTPAPNTAVTCTAVSTLAPKQREAIQIYDSKFLLSLFEGSETVAISTIAGAREANAQSLWGETVLMKACRHVVEHKDRKWIVRVLIDKGADPMVCCESGKNLLHDLFWVSRAGFDSESGAVSVEEAQSMHNTVSYVIDTIRQKVGFGQLLRLLFSQERRGDTPLDYINPVLQPHWQELLDKVLSVASATLTAGSHEHEPGESTLGKRAEEEGHASRGPVNGLSSLDEHQNEQQEKSEPRTKRKRIEDAAPVVGMDELESSDPEGEDKFHKFLMAQGVASAEAAEQSSPG